MRAITNDSNMGGMTPTGTKSITTNGTHDVTEYAEANVAVPGVIDPSKFPNTITVSSTAYNSSSDGIRMNYLYAYVPIFNIYKKIKASYSQYVQTNGTVTFYKNGSSVGSLTLSTSWQNIPDCDYLYINNPSGKTGNANASSTVTLSKT